MEEFTFKHGNSEDLDLIKPLWEKLNQLHLDLSQNFKSRFQNKTWESRKNDLIKKSGEIRIDYVTDDKTASLDIASVQSTEKMKKLEKLIQYTSKRFIEKRVLKNS